MEIKQKKTISIEELLVLENNTENTDNSFSSDDVNKIKSEKDRYYLPVLNINRPEFWPPKSIEERKLFDDKNAEKTCLGNCCGVEGLKGACCHLDPFDLEHVLGPVDKENKERWVQSTIKWFKQKGLNFNRQDLVIDYEEGKIIGETLFKETGNKNIFQHEGAYPFIRFQVIGPRYACKFMSPLTYKCQIYEVRPEMCRTYYCQYVLSNFLVKTKNHPNRWQIAK